MKVVIDEMKCVGAGICVMEEPGFFRFREGSKQAKVLNPDVPAALEDKMRKVARKCPNSAIIIEEDDGTVWRGEN